METAISIVILISFIGLFVGWMMRRPLPGQLQPGNTRMAQATHALTAVKGPLAGKEFPLYGAEAGLTLGRQPDNDIVLEGQLVSRRHAQLVVSGQAVILRDLESMNGTWVAGSRVAERVLEPGEAFQIGPHTFVLTGRGSRMPSIGQPGGRSVAQPLPEAGSQPRQYIPSSSLSLEEARDLRIEDYELFDTIGFGAAAVVFRARRHGTGDTVAIKVLRDTAEDYFRQKFSHEATIALHLRHPNIVRCYSAVTEPDCSYIIMEYMKDGSLRALLSRQGGKLPLNKAVDITSQICAALDFAHDLGIVHRDLKPENILLDGNTVKLGDFGIARLTGVKTITRDGMIVGTPIYMSYEQAKGLPVDRRSDQYSLAIVLFEMLTGQPPYQDHNPLNIVSMHLQSQPPRPRSLNPAIPPAVEDVILRGMSKDASRRFQTLGEMVKALGGPTMVSSPASLPKPAQKPGALNGPRLVGVASSQVIPIGSGETVIGRQALGGHAAVSSRHACLRRNGNVVTVEDLNSMNGTWVNHRRIGSTVVLSPGATVQFGPVAYQYVVS